MKNTGKSRGQRSRAGLCQRSGGFDFAAGKRLRRFAKVSLEPGQSKTLTFKLRREDLSFIGADNKPIAEPGEFDVKIGGLTQKFTLK